MGGGIGYWWVFCWCIGMIVLLVVSRPFFLFLVFFFPFSIVGYGTLFSVQLVIYFGRGEC